MYSLLGYAQTFEEDYDIRFVEVRIMHYLDDMISSSFLAASSKATCESYIRVRKMSFKHQGLLCLSMKPGENASAANTFCITPLADQSLYIPSEEDNLIVIQTPDAFAKNSHMPALYT